MSKKGFTDYKKFRRSEQSHIGRDDSQFQTPVPVCKYMVSLLPAGCRSVLEPTPGRGNIVTELHRSGFQVTAPTDFFLLPSGRFDAVVMNPPFSARYMDMHNAPDRYNRKGMAAGYLILWDCLQMSDRVVALMPWFTLSDSDRRLTSLMDYGVKSLTHLPRSTFGFARIQTVVIEFVKGWDGVTAFHCFGRTNDQQKIIF